MDLRKLEIFLKLLDTRSFSKTASMLGLAQPSVSASLKSLEEGLGQKLFERTPRAVTPLAAAETLAPYAQNILETAARAAWAVGHQMAGVKEKLILGASSVPSVVFVPKAAAMFSRSYPDVMIKLKSGRSSEIIKKVADGEIDLGLVGTQPEDATLNSAAFSRDNLVLLASKKLAAEIGPPPKSAEDLLKWPFIMREDGSGTKAAFLIALGHKAGDLAAHIKVKAEVEGLAPLLALVRESLGASVVSSLLLTILNLENLMAVKLDFFEGRRFYLISRKMRQQSPALDAMIKTFENAFK